MYTANAPQPGWGGGIDVFLAELTPGTPGNGGIVFSTYLGAVGSYVGKTLVVGPDGTIYVGGYGTIGLPSSSNGNGFDGGTADGFLAVYK